jgi:hypothetical protein
LSAFFSVGSLIFPFAVFVSPVFATAPAYIYFRGATTYEFVKHCLFTFTRAQYPSEALNVFTDAAAA